jgi:hypothetical protein
VVGLVALERFVPEPEPPGLQPPVRVTRYRQHRRPSAAHSEFRNRRSCIPSILGGGGISEEVNESDLGGTAIGVKFIVGR